MDWTKNNCKTRQETFKFWDLVRLILEIWRYCKLPLLSENFWTYLAPLMNIVYDSNNIIKTLFVCLWTNHWNSPGCLHISFHNRHNTESVRTLLLRQGRCNSHEQSSIARNPFCLRQLTQVHQHHCVRNSYQQCPGFCGSLGKYHRGLFY